MPNSYSPTPLAALVIVLASALAASTACWEAGNDDGPANLDAADDRDNACYTGPGADSGTCPSNYERTRFNGVECCRKSCGSDTDCETSGASCTAGYCLVEDSSGTTSGSSSGSGSTTGTTGGTTGYVDATTTDCPAGQEKIQYDDETFCAESCTEDASVSSCDFGERCLAGYCVPAGDAG